MSIKIIKEGKSEFTAICDICSCEFSYELIDLDPAKMVSCPHCRNFIKHESQKPALYIPYNYYTIPCSDDGTSITGTYIENDLTRPNINYDYAATVYSEDNTAVSKNDLIDNNPVSEFDMREMLDDASDNTIKFMN